MFFKSSILINKKDSFFPVVREVDGSKNKKHFLLLDFCRQKLNTLEGTHERFFGGWYYTQQIDLFSFFTDVPLKAVFFGKKIVYVGLVLSGFRLDLGTKGYHTNDEKWVDIKHRRRRRKNRKLLFKYQKRFVSSRPCFVAFKARRRNEVSSSPAAEGDFASPDVCLFDHCWTLHPVRKRQETLHRRRRSRLLRTRVLRCDFQFICYRYSSLVPSHWLASPSVTATTNLVQSYFLSFLPSLPPAHRPWAEPKKAGPARRDSLLPFPTALQGSPSPALQGYTNATPNSLLLYHVFPPSKRLLGKNLFRGTRPEQKAAKHGRAGSSDSPAEKAVWTGPKRPVKAKQDRRRSQKWRRRLLRLLITAAFWCGQDNGDCCCRTSF